MTTPTGILFYDPQVKPLSTAGQFQGACYLYFYSTGTTSQTNVYADGDLDTPLSQPVTADGAGRFVPIYLDPATIYRVQLYTAGGVLLEDTDPVVPLPIPASVTTLISDVSQNTSAIATLQAAVTAIQSAVPWSSITVATIPAPIEALATSTPPGTGQSYWCDNGTWSIPGGVGGTVTQGLSSDVTSIGNTFADVFTAIPVTAGASYAMYAEIGFVCGSNASLSTQMVPSTGALTQLGGAQSSAMQDSVGTWQTLCNSTDSGNAAVPGLSADTIYASVTNQLVLRGRFTVPAGCTTVKLQMKTGGSTSTAKTGSFIQLTQIIAA